MDEYGFVPRLSLINIIMLAAQTVLGGDRGQLFEQFPENLVKVLAALSVVCRCRGLRRRMSCILFRVLFYNGNNKSRFTFLSKYHSHYKLCTRVCKMLYG